VRVDGSGDHYNPYYDSVCLRVASAFKANRVNMMFGNG
jgi:hypothetical protein